VSDAALVVAVGGWTFVVVNMGKSIDQFLTHWLPWLSDISDVHREFLYWVVPIAVGFIWAFFQWGVPAARKAIKKAITGGGSDESFGNHVSTNLGTTIIVGDFGRCGCASLT
jgi:hypothetical protein